MPCLRPCWPGASELQRIQLFKQPCREHGRTSVTLRDVGDYIANLPKKESDLPEWQDAVQALMLVEHGWPMMFAQWRDASIEPRPQNCLAATHLKHGNATK
jgi:hypothetical protein